MGKLKDGTEYAGVGDDDNDAAVEPDSDKDDREQRLKNLQGHARGQWERENFEGGSKKRSFTDEMDMERGAQRSFKMNRKMSRAKDMLRSERGRR